MRKRRLPEALLFLLAAAPFAACWWFGYVNIDDTDYFVTPPIILRGLSPEGLAWALTDMSNAIWMPLTWLCYQLDYTIRNVALGWFPGLDGFQFAYTLAHVQSVLLHAFNAVLLYRFLRKLAGAKGLALPFLGAALWAVHPLRVESVVWIASFKDVLSMTFLLLALLAWLGYREDGEWGAYVRSHVFFLLGCCAKPSVMTFPAMVMLLDAVVLGKISLRKEDARGWLAYVPSILIALPTAVLAQVAQTAGGATGHQSLIPFWYKALNAAVSLGVYVRNTVWPTRLAVQCQIQWPRAPLFFVPGLLIGAVVVLGAAWAGAAAFRRLLRGRLSGRHAQAGLLWAVGTMVPMLGLSSFGGHAFADRFTYIPFVGLCIALLGIRETAAVRAAGCAALLALALMTARQTDYWRDDGRLLTRTLEIDGDLNVLAHLNIAHYLYEYEHTPENVQRAAEHFARAYELNAGLSQRATILYMMALGECGRTENFPKIQLDFIRWLREKCGIWNSVDQDITDGLCDLYGASGVDAADARPERAKKLARELLAAGDHGVYQVDYFIYLVGKVTGDAELCDAGLAGLRRLADPRTGHDSAIRFRFAYEPGADKGEEAVP